MSKTFIADGVIGSRTNPESIKTWAYSYHDCLSLTTCLNEMRDPDTDNVQMEHKEEGKARIKADGKDRQALREKLAVCIDPLNPEEHPSGLVNIVECPMFTGDYALHIKCVEEYLPLFFAAKHHQYLRCVQVMMNESINVDQAMDLGKMQQEAFEAGWPETFHMPVTATVVTWTENKTAINVNGQMVMDVGIFYARALALHASQWDGVPTISDMLATELAPVATSMFDNECQMRIAAKSVLKK